MIQKRKRSEIDTFPLSELNEDVLERVLSRLPTSSFFRLTSVCKKWKSVANSATFKLSCSQIQSRDPWFYMVESQPNSSRPVIFDSTEGNWKKLNQPPVGSIPVASSGGLLCFRRESGGLILNNPITSSSRHIPAPFTNPKAIGMISNSETLKIVVISGELPNLTFRQYNSEANQWKDETALARKIGSETATDPQYFLSKCGNVVSTDIQRSPPKQYSSLLTVKNGEEILYFLSSSGTVVACNLTLKYFFEYPRLLPVFSEYSIDLVECGGDVYVVLLSEFLESASLRVWSWDDGVQSWRQVAAMPPWMSHKFYGKKVDINCSGAGQRMFVCLNSVEICSYMMCDLTENEWVELPEFESDDGELKDFVCAFSFEPRIEASTW